DAALSLSARLGQADFTRGSVAGVYLDGSPEYIAAMLAVLASGGIFLPLNTSFPSDRLKSILDKTTPEILITSESRAEDLSAKLFSDRHSSFIRLSDALSQDFHHSCLTMASLQHSTSNRIKPAVSPPTGSSEPDQGCYIMCTSGSTGEPKAILGSDAGLRHFIQWEITEFDLDNSVRVSQLAPVSFDVSLRDLFVPLLCGGTAVIPHEDVTRNPNSLLDWMERTGITLSHMVPTLFRMLTRECSRRALQDGHKGHFLQNLQRILIAGEPLYGDDIHQWRNVLKNDIELVNLYGPSETTLAKCFYRISKESTLSAGDIVPLGRPLPDTEIFVLADGRPCTINETGEIHIRTPFMSLGYIGAPQLNEASFVPNPLSGNSDDIVYRTGDLGRLTDDGCILFEGRKDTQVKLYGNRIDLGEIEVILRHHPAVHHAAVTLKRSTIGEMRLIGYIVPESSSPPTTESLHQFARKHLPPYMVPALYVILDSLPLTHNNKLDRSALPDPDGRRPVLEQAFVPPSTDLEKTVSEIWSHILGIAGIGILDNFFDVGGTSVLAVRTIDLLHERLHVQVPIIRFFEYPNIKMLCGYLTNQHRNTTSSIGQIEMRAEKYRERTRHVSPRIRRDYGKSS
nr:non-ribosomal peptide synthetase [Deltaproteobacteria bacterium]